MTTPTSLPLSRTYPKVAVVTDVCEDGGRSRPRRRSRGSRGSREAHGGIPAGHLRSWALNTSARIRFAHRMSLTSSRLIPRCLIGTPSALKHGACFDDALSRSPKRLKRAKRRQLRPAEPKGRRAGVAEIPTSAAAEKRKTGTRPAMATSALYSKPPESRAYPTYVPPMARGTYSPPQETERAQASPKHSINHVDLNTVSGCRLIDQYSFAIINY